MWEVGLGPDEMGDDLASEVDRAVAEVRDAGLATERAGASVRDADSRCGILVCGMFSSFSSPGEEGERGGGCADRSQV